MRGTILIPTLLFAAACGGGPTEAEQNLSERGEGAEQIVNTGTGNITPGTAPPAEQGQFGDTMPDKPGGPSSDRASGTGGDTVPSQ